MHSPTNGNTMAEKHQPQPRSQQMQQPQQPRRKQGKTKLRASRSFEELPPPRSPMSPGGRMMSVAEIQVPRRRVCRRASTGSGGSFGGGCAAPHGHGHGGHQNQQHDHGGCGGGAAADDGENPYGYGYDEPPSSQEGQNLPPRMGRRASSGGGGSSRNLCGGSDEQQSASRRASGGGFSRRASGGGVSRRASGGGGGGDPTFRRTPRRGSLSKQESERKLCQSLTQVSDYRDSDRDDTIQMLKERFSSGSYGYGGSGGNGSGNRAAMVADSQIPDEPTANQFLKFRRSSISSVASTQGHLSGGGSPGNLTPPPQQQPPPDTVNFGNGNGVGAASASAFAVESSLSTLNASSLNASSSLNTSSFLNASSVTLPVSHVSRSSAGSADASSARNNTSKCNNNVDDMRSARTDQIIESLVWFSFHTPRAVLEDLIAHEMVLWRKEAERQKARSGRMLKKLLRKKKKEESERKKRIAGGGDYKMSYMMRDEEDDDEEDSDSGSVSSLSDQEAGSVFDGNFSECILRQRGVTSSSKIIKLPKSVKRECALLFVDMSGFTRLSTLLDVESLSKVINSYFDMIVSEVIQYGGDVLKFAGDAFFAEWRVAKEEDDDDDEEESDLDSDLVAESRGSEKSRKNKKKRKKKKKKKGKKSNPLAELNASLASINEVSGDDEDVPKLSKCVLAAARCAASIVEKFSDYQVMTASNTSEAMLNVHCGVGCGNLVGLHVGDYKEDQEEEAVELRREFLILGSPIDQVSKAADIAADGEVLCSPEAMTALAFCCDLTPEQLYSKEPVCIASRDEVFFEVFPEFNQMNINNGNSSSGIVPTALQPYESLRMHCKALNHAALARLHLQMALYVHPVIRGDELAMSAAILAGKITKPPEALESRHRAEAELRSVLTIFIKAVLSPRITGFSEVDEELFQTLNNIMHVTSRELDRYSGHLRQFIVDDKGVVLIATFGLRGSTFPNMVSNNGLPAVFAIHRSLKSELAVENRVGATFGKCYCGVVGGVRRHEFAVMGAPVNLAARLMASKVNKGILVDEAVSEQADSRFTFNNLPPVEAKGYDHPVAIFEPTENTSANKRKKSSSLPFIGRSLERETVINVSSAILETPEHAQITMVFLMGESGMGKSALASMIADDIKKKNNDKTDTSKTIICAKSSSSETQQRIPLSSYRKVFQSIVREFCEQDGTLSAADDGRSLTSSNSSTGNSFQGPLTPKTPLMKAPRFRGLSRSQLTTGSDHRGSDHSRPSTVRELSMRDISADFASPRNIRMSLKKTDGGKKLIPNLSQSTHGGDIAKPQQKGGKRANSLILPQSLMPNLSQSNHGGDKAKPQQKGGKRANSLTLAQSLHRLPPTTPQNAQKESLGQSLKQMSSSRLSASPRRASRLKVRVGDDCSVPDGSCTNMSVDTASHTANNNAKSVPFFEKLCWVCEELAYPYEYADIVGSQFLGLDGASPVTTIEGHVPTMDELSEFLALAFICLTDYADMTIVVLDDFQWVDAFSWKIFQVLGKKAQKLLLICAARSHDKQALRRLSTAASGQNQLQSKMIEISLGPFDFSEIRLLTSRVLVHGEHAISDDLCTDIFQRTGGLPVYVIQVLENIKRNKSLELDESGVLQWTAEGLKEKRAFASNKTGVVMEETFLSRFDALDVRVRKILQTCAVLGLSFSLSDVIQVHPDMDELDIASALEAAVDEMILVENIEDDEETSLKTESTGAGDSNTDTHDSVRLEATNGPPNLSDRFFQFSHTMWRQNVLTTMLKERKMELHRLIAEAMERDEVLVLEQSDISRLLTLFDHWKSCGDFCKTAPLALAVGARLEEWDLCSQSLELYEDALEMSFDTVQRMDGVDEDNSEWVSVAAKPAVLDYILRLHIRIGLCHQNLGEEHDSICMFEDAYNIIKTSSKVPSSSKPLMMPIISSLCVLKLDQIAYDTRTKLEQEKLAEKFVKEAIENGNPVHIGRALAMEAGYYAKLGKLDRAFDSLEKLKSMYDVEANSFDMLAEYGRDFALECICESIQWYYLDEEEEEAESQADAIIRDLLPLLAPVDADIAMYAIFPIIQVLRLVGRATDAEDLLKKYIVVPFQENGSLADYWEPLFNPLAYLLELIVMEENEEEDPRVLADMEEYVLEEANYDFSPELERKAHTIMGEICWRLLMYKSQGEPSRGILMAKVRDLLTPVAKYPHPEIFLKRTSEALLEAL